MKIKRILISEKGNLIADIGKGTYVGRLNSMELAICKKSPRGFVMHKQVVAGMMMRTVKEFTDCIHMLTEKECAIQPASANV